MTALKLILLCFVLLAVVLAGPWIASVLSPITAYLIQILAALAIIYAAFSACKNFSYFKNSEELVSLAAHQLSSPLTSLRWAIRMLLNGDFGKLSTEQNDVLDEAYKKTGQLVSMIETLLDFSRNGDVKKFLNKKQRNFSNAALGVFKLYQREIFKKKINFKFAFEESLPDVKMDSQKISFVIQNLLENAIYYTPPGGEIFANTKKRGKSLEFSIKDSGIGVPKKQKNKIFQKFFRGSNAKKENPQGHGLGLYFAKKIVDAHGGKIWFSSGGDSGSIFYFTLPI